MLTDKELDQLLTQSAKRQKAEADITANVMRTVNRDLRRKRLIKWAKLLGICFGLPLAMVLYFFACKTAVSALNMQPQLSAVCIVLPTITLGVLIARKLRHFHPEM